MTDAYPEITRVDAHDKVRGATRFGADDSRSGMLHGALAIATVGRGRIRVLDTEAARGSPGVRMVLTHRDMAGMESAGFLNTGGYAFQSLQVMLSTAIAYRGQPIALVVADTFENATRGAERITATYESQPLSFDLENPPAADVVEQTGPPLPPPVVAGEADAAFAAAPIQIDSAYTSPAQHQNPMELISTVAEWRDGTLTIHEGTQNAESIRHGLMAQLKLPADKVSVLSPYTGGGFGQKNALQTPTLLAAMAAMRMRRPVKIVMTRAQIFHNASFRPASRHRVRLGGDANGKIVAAIHESDQQTSRHDLFIGGYGETSARLEGIANFRGRERLVRMDTQTPGFMRNPWESVAAFVFESTVDEMAYAMGVDPVALRLNNDTTVDPVSGKPLSSRHVSECLTRGAERFGWARRTAAPGSMVAEDGTQIGWGVALGCYPGNVAPAIAKLRVLDTGEINLSVSGHEMGQGIRTVLANFLSVRLGVPVESIVIDIGTTGRTPQHLTAGSWGTASALPAVAGAADKLQASLREAAPGVRDGAPLSDYLRAAGRPSLEVEARSKGPGQPDSIYRGLANGNVVTEGPDFPAFVTYSYIAHFVEVRIEPTTRRIRVARVVSVADCGRVMSPRTARSQVQGGVVWGIGAALREESEVDPRFGGFLNANYADYVVPVNADIGSIEVEFVDKPDPLFNALGVKNLGEVSMSGVAPAIANAVFHATGRRLRSLPFRIEHLL